jgi:hypothetical protein
MTKNFNRGKFNTSSASLAVTGVAKLALTAGVCGGLALFAPQSGAMVQLKAAGSAVRRFKVTASTANLAVNVSGKATLRLFSAKIDAITALNLNGTVRRAVFAIASDANLHLYCRGSGKRRFFAEKSNIAVHLLSTGKPSLNMFSVASESEIGLAAKGIGNRHFTALAEPSVIGLHAKGAVTMLGYATISLPGLVITPGGDLVIDTEQMTVTLNGDDVTRFFDADSEFFKLKPGDNIVLYEDGQENRDISYKILWKDLWL